MYSYGKTYHNRRWINDHEDKHYKGFHFSDSGRSKSEKSQAEKEKDGHAYVINGEGKLGRRLWPND